MHQNYFDPAAMLLGRVGRVGTGDVLVEPGRPYMNPYAWAPPAGATPLSPYYPPGFSPNPCGPPCFPLPDCPPQGAAFYARAANSALAAQGTQIPLPINSRDNTVTPAASVAAGLIVAGATAVITNSPTVPLCITQYRVARTSAPFFDVMSIRAARQEFMGDGGGTPADDFAADSNSPPGQFPQLFPGTTISVTVRNNDGANHAYGSAFYGYPGPSCAPCL